MRFEILLTSIILALVFLMGGLLIITEGFGNYGITLDANDTTFENVTVYSGTSPFYSDVKDQSLNLKNSLESSPISTDTAENNMFSAGFLSVIRVWDFIDVIGSLLAAVAIKFHIPPFLIGAFMTILLLTISITVIYMIFRFMPRG